jgi:guanine nucleotide-binding protein G(i) subunit alpha
MERVRGTGEASADPRLSRQSTILKQMKLIHQGSYTDTERESYKEIIYSNTVQSMHVSQRSLPPSTNVRSCASSQVILDAMDMMGITTTSPDGARYMDIIMELPHQIEADYLDPEVTTAIAGLWNDAGVREAFGRSREFQLNDSAS